MLATFAKAGVAGAHDRLRAVGRLELAEDAGDVVLHRLDAQHQPIGDRRIAVPLGDQLQYLALALGQVREGARGARRGGAGLLGRACVLQACREVLHHPLGDRRAENRFAAIHGADGAH